MSHLYLSAYLNQDVIKKGKITTDVVLLWRKLENKKIHLFSGLRWEMKFNSLV